MKDIKEKVKGKKPKIRNPASRLPKELVRSAVLEAKEKSRELPGRAGAGTGEESPTEYAGNKIEAAEYRIGSEAGSAAYRGGKRIAKKSREVIRERREEKRAVQSAREAAAETASASSQTGQGKDAGNVSRKRDTAQVRIKEKQKGKAGVM